MSDELKRELAALIYEGGGRLYVELTQEDADAVAERLASAFQQVGWCAECCGAYIHPVEFTPSQMHSSIPHDWVTYPVYRFVPSVSQEAPQA